MPAFTYEAIVPGGGRTQGVLEARSRQEALSLLTRQRLQPVRLQQEGVTPAGPAAAASPGTGGGASRAMTEAQVIAFTEELGDLLDAGLQLEGALKMMEQRSEASSLKAVAESLRAQVREGVSLSRALKSASASFSDLYCNLVAAGEVSGALGSILQRQVVYLKKLSDLKGRVIQALIYPMFVTGAGILLMVLFVVVLVPQLETLFKTQTPPLITQLLLGTSRFLVAWGWLVLVTILFGAVAFWQAIQRPAGKLWWDQARVKIPVAGPVLEAAFYAQFSQTLANLLGNGVTLLQAMQLVSRATPNSYYRVRLEKASEQISEGYSLNRALRQVGGFSDMFLDLVAVGEQTGELAKALDKAGARYEKEMDRRIQKITALIQPVIIVIIALVVGAVVYSIITSIFDAMSGMRKSL